GLLHQATLGLHTAHQAGLVHGHLHAGGIVLTADGTLKVCGLGEPPWLVEPPLAQTAEGSTEAADLSALGECAAAWVGTNLAKKLAKAKPLLEVVQRLGSEAAEQRYANSVALLTELHRIAP